MKQKQKQKQAAAIYVRLRAAGYSIAEAARLLGLKISEAWELERAEAEEISVEAAFLELKRATNKQ
jgi:hypothetical protein